MINAIINNIQRWDKCSTSNWWHQIVPYTSLFAALCTVFWALDCDGMSQFFEGLFFLEMVLSIGSLVFFLKDVYRDFKRGTLMYAFAPKPWCLRFAAFEARKQVANLAHLALFGWGVVLIWQLTHQGRQKEEEYMNSVVIILSIWLFISTLGNILEAVVGMNRVLKLVKLRRIFTALAIIYIIALALCAFGTSVMIFKGPNTTNKPSVIIFGLVIFFKLFRAVNDFYKTRLSGMISCAVSSTMKESKHGKFTTAMTYFGAVVFVVACVTGVLGALTRLASSSHPISSAKNHQLSGTERMQSRSIMDPQKVSSHDSKLPSLLLQSGPNSSSSTDNLKTAFGCFSAINLCFLTVLDVATMLVNLKIRRGDQTIQCIEDFIRRDIRIGTKWRFEDVVDLCERATRGWKKDDDGTEMSQFSFTEVVDNQSCIAEDGLSQRINEEPYPRERIPSYRDETSGLLALAEDDESSESARSNTLIGPDVFAQRGRASSSSSLGIYASQELTGEVTSEYTFCKAVHGEQDVEETEPKIALDGFEFEPRTSSEPSLGNRGQLDSRSQPFTRSSTSGFTLSSLSLNTSTSESESSLLAGRENDALTQRICLESPLQGPEPINESLETSGQPPILLGRNICQQEQVALLSQEEPLSAQSLDSDSWPSDNLVNVTESMNS